LCVKGWNAHQFVNHPQRLITPYLKEGGELQPEGWDGALSFVSRELLRIRDKYGPDSIGFLSSAKCTNEENYLLMKLARAAVGTNNIDHCARL
jgi:predicted molibdopterin-dependent oxidoreductase YjgC